VIFDVDGTLVDTNYHHALAWYRAFARHDVVIPTWRIHRAIGMGGDRLVSHVAGQDVEDRLGDQLRSDWKQIYETMLPEVTGFDGAHELVATAASHGWKIALASSGDPAHTKHYIDLLNLHTLADDWTTADDVSTTKPSPDLLHTALQRVGPSPAVLIGDSTWDCAAAARAGIPCVTLLTGGFSAAELKSAGAAAVFEDLPTLRAALTDLPFHQPTFG
jgi:HAD superfamily hydrolase (TIGR01549 family)